jgi:transcriptional regulator with XRE-family HTH domain
MRSTGTASSPSPLNKNAFGRLVRAYRQQRGWSQEQLAQQWGFDRTYVSHIESGKRQLTQHEQIHRLAEILGIPLEHLAAIGQRLPAEPAPPPQQPSEADDFLLQALLEPAQATVKLS